MPFLFGLFLLRHFSEIEPVKYADQVEHVKRLIEKAGKVDSTMTNPADTALKFSQAALNAAHAIAVLEQIPDKPAS